MNKSIPIYEIFTSFSGEVSLAAPAGTKTLFVRVAGCNLRCLYCDTEHAQVAEAAKEHHTPESLSLVIMRQLVPNGIRHILFTGGEPLLYQEQIGLVCSHLFNVYPYLSVTIETNGTIVPVAPGLMTSKVCIVADIKSRDCWLTGGMTDIDFSILSRIFTGSYEFGCRRSLDAYHVVFKLVATTVHEVDDCLTYIMRLYDESVPASLQYEMPTAKFFISPVMSRSPADETMTDYEGTTSVARRIIALSQFHPLFGTRAKNAELGINFQMHKMLPFR